MPSPNPILDELDLELRALPAAPDSLRERVRAIAAREPEPAPRRSFRLFGLPPRRAALMLVPAALAAVLAAAAVDGLIAGLGDNGGTHSAATRLIARPTPQPAPAPVRAPKQTPSRGVVHGGRSLGAPGTVTTIEGGGSAASAPPPAGFDAATAAPSAAPLPPSRSRLQRYRAELRVRVDGIDGLSQATADAMRFTRRLGGYVASVNYDTPGGKGDAELSLRVPTTKVQEAVVRFSQLGTILYQHVSIQDLQALANRQSDSIDGLRRYIALLQTSLEKPNLSEVDRVRLKLQLENAQASLKSQTGRHQQTLREGRLATVSLALTTRKGAVAPTAHHQGRIGRATGHAVSFLAKIVAGTLYVLIVLSPFLLVSLAGLMGFRFLRRRDEQRLLERA